MTEARHESDGSQHQCYRQQRTDPYSARRLCKLCLHTYGLDRTLTLNTELRRIRSQRIAANPNLVVSGLDDLAAGVIEE